MTDIPYWHVWTDDNGVSHPPGWTGEWHENPAPQWIVPLSGRWFVETMDGKRVEMGPDELSFGNDQNTKQDSQGRKGHRSGQWALSHACSCWYR